MRTTRKYTLLGTELELDKFLDKLSLQGIRYKEELKESETFCNNGELSVSINMSDDMITEVEELLHEIAEKTGVRIE